MGVEIKNLGFGFALILKNTQRRFKTNIKELTSDNFLKRSLGDLMGLKGVLFQNSPIRFKK
ncbi:hypothetical protein E5E84_00845 [Helicobacter pylori]|nr:hypothetical protein E5E84_00845 [Helicobacter pylori]